jgi:Kef-type K+ transport system membrane component KefB
MALPEGLADLAVIVGISAAAPLLVGRLPGPRIPEVVLLIIAGVLVGPQVLGLAQIEPSIELIANVGLGMLFFLAGFELDRVALLGRAGRTAALAWAVSIAAALAIVGALAAVGFVRAWLPVSIALTTTALGALLPILRDSGELGGPFGRAVLANGAIGELLPIVAISVFLSSQGAWGGLAMLLLFGLIAVAVSRVTLRLRGRTLSQMVQGGANTSSQTTVRVTVLLLVVLLFISGELGLDVVLGAFAAGIVLRLTLPEGDHALEHKLDGLAFGFFIPAFFVVSGMRIDVESILRSPSRMFVFFGLIVLIRGIPVMLAHRGGIPGRDAVRLGLFAATGLPLIVAITEIGLTTGEMLPENGAALVGAGLLTVLVLPMTARLIGGPGGDPGAAGTPEAAVPAEEGRPG